MTCSFCGALIVKCVWPLSKLNMNFEMLVNFLDLVHCKWTLFSNFCGCELLEATELDVDVHVSESF